MFIPNEMIIDLENLKVFLLELINELNMVAGHKINIQKSTASLYVSNEKLEKELKQRL